MKTLFLSLLLIFPLLAHADDAAQVSALKSADKVRVEAMKAGDKAQLTAVFSDDLRYAHSNGVVDTKPTFVEVLSTQKTKYVGYDYEEQNFTFPAPGIALMTGRAHVIADSDGKHMDSVLSFLAVWRLEAGKWRFLAWQSCKLPPVTK